MAQVVFHVTVWKVKKSNLYTKFEASVDFYSYEEMDEFVATYNNIEDDDYFYDPEVFMNDAAREMIMNK